MLTAENRSLATHWVALTLGLLSEDALCSAGGLYDDGFRAFAKEVVARAAELEPLPEGMSPRIAEALVITAMAEKHVELAAGASRN